MLPTRLQQPQYRFIKVIKGDKRPQELDWTKSHNYTFDDNRLQDWIKDGGNYGVCGGFGNIVILDWDNIQEHDKVKQLLPSTFTVLSGGKGYPHYYYQTDKAESFKILDDKKNTICDIQGPGKMVVGPGSRLYTGNVYSVLNDAPISYITISELKAILDTTSGHMTRCRVNIKENRNSDDESLSFKIKSKVRYTDILIKYGIDASRNPCMCPLGHDSQNGKCFSFKDIDGIAHCFHCDFGGDIINLVQIKENKSFISACKWIVDQFGLDIELDDIKQKKKQLADSAINGDIILAQQFHDAHTYFYDSSRIWWLWDNENYLWRRVDEYDLLNVMISWQMIPDITKSHRRNEIIEMMKLIGREHKPKDFPKDWIQFKDKIIDITRMQQYEATPEYFCINPIPWALGNSEETPIIDSLFLSWVGEEKKDILYEIMAYCMLADYPLQKIFCLVGSGSNGKSCYLSILRNFIGRRNIAQADLDMIMTNNFAVSGLFKKLACEMSETNFGTIKRTNVLKRLSSGQDLVRFEFKGKDAFEDINYAKLILATNNMPPTGDTSRGYYRRWIIIRFPNEFTEKKDVLANITDKEYENLARKLIRILKELLQRREFTGEGSIDEKTKIYEDISNPQERFLREMTIPDDDGYIFKFELKDILNGWLRKNGHRQLSDTEIYYFMKDKYHDGKRSYESVGIVKRYNAWEGLRWRDQLSSDVKQLSKTISDKDFFRVFLREQGLEEKPFPIVKSDELNDSIVKFFGIDSAMKKYDYWKLHGVINHVSSAEKDLVMINIDSI